MSKTFVDRHYKWIASGVLLIGIFMTLLDTTIVDIVLPKMIASLNTDTYGIQWVITIYLIGSAVTMTTVGWLGKKISYYWIYMIGISLFTLMSFFCSQASSLSQMVTFRLFQGVGEGLVVTIGLTMMYRVFPPEERGTAIGIYGLGAMMAPSIGPALGGLLTEHFAWRSIFFVNIPVGIIGIILTMLFLSRIKGERDKSAHLNWPSLLLLSIALASLITFLSKGQEKGWTQSNFILNLIIVFVVSMALYLWNELRSDNPLLDHKLFKIANFRNPVIVLAFVSFVAYGSLLLLPLYMENLRGYPTLTTGLVILPMGLFTAIFSVAGGIASDRYSPKWVLFVGVLLLAIGSWTLTLMDLYTSKYTIVFYLLLYGVPMGLCFPPAQAIAFADLEESSVNMGSAITNVVRLVTGSIATSFSVTVFERARHRAYVSISEHATLGHKPLLYAYKKLSLLLHRVGTPENWINYRAKTVLKMLQDAYAAETAFQNTFYWLVFFALTSIIFVMLIKWDKNRKVKKVAMH